MEIRSKIPSIGELSSFLGSHRGLPTCSHPRKTQKISRILLQEVSLPVQIHAFRSLCSSSCVNQAPSSSGGTPEMSEGGSTSTPLSGRCPDSVTVIPPGQRGPSVDLELPPTFGILGQSGEKLLAADTNSHLGLKLDTVLFHISLSDETGQSYQGSGNDLQLTMGLHRLATLQGLMVSCQDTIPWPRFHLRPLQSLLRPYLHLIE